MGFQVCPSSARLTVSTPINSSAVYRCFLVVAASKIRTCPRSARIGETHPLSERFPARGRQGESSDLENCPLPQDSSVTHKGEVRYHCNTNERQHDREDNRERPGGRFQRLPATQPPEDQVMLTGR